jgi:Fe-S-cluster containining protein
MTEFKECQVCYGWCCGAYTITPLREGEVSRISSYLDMSESEFRKRFVQMSGYEKDDQEFEGIKPSTPCPFWQKGLCAIHPVKPATCANYGPFNMTLKECQDYHKAWGHHEQ